MFGTDKLESDLDIKNTHATRKNEDILLNEYIPMKPIGTKGMKIERSSYGDNNDTNLFF
jgi:hypothetical protein